MSEIMVVYSDGSMIGNCGLEISEKLPLSNKAIESVRSAIAKLNNLENVIIINYFELGSDK